MQLHSPAFENEGTIPRLHAMRDEGDNVSPPLEWSGAPELTRQFALLCEDPDAPRPEPWVHWIVAGIAGDQHSIAESAGRRFIQGTNDFGQVGWGGPLPPEGHGPHRYIFTLYTLDRCLDLPQGLDKARLLQAIDGITLAEAQLIGIYER